MKKQYYLKVPECRANYSSNPDCICWHDEGTAPRFATYDKDSYLSWREVPTIMTDTPRTDAETAKLGVESLGATYHSPHVSADFARQLERENAELADALEGMMSAFDFLPCDPSEFCPDAWSAAKSAIAKAKGVQP